MHFASKSIIAASMLLAVACDQQPGLIGPLPILDAKEILRTTSLGVSVAVTTEPQQVGPFCQWDVPTPPPGWTATIAYGDLAQLEPANIWFPPEQPALPYLAFTGPEPWRSPSYFMSFSYVDLAQQDAPLRERGFTGPPFAVNCNGTRHQQYLSFGAAYSIEELGRDGTTLEEMKTILTETATLGPVLDPNSVLDVNDGSEPSDVEQ